MTPPSSPLFLSATNTQLCGEPWAVEGMRLRRASLGKTCRIARLRPADARRIHLDGDRFRPIGGRARLAEPKSMGYLLPVGRSASGGEPSVVAPPNSGGRRT